MYNSHNPRRSERDIFDISQDNMMSIVLKMSQGNSGAANVMVQLFIKNADIDPDSVFGEYSTVLMLDSMGIYGSEIWILFKDICDQNIHKMILLLRAVQLGYVTWDEVYDALDSSQFIGINHTWEDLNHKVCTRLEGFKSL